MEPNANILDQNDVMRLMGYEHPGHAERRLRAEGVKPFYGRHGRWFITLDQLNAARGIIKSAANNDELL